MVGVTGLEAATPPPRPSWPIWAVSILSVAGHRCDQFPDLLFLSNNVPLPEKTMRLRDFCVSRSCFVMLRPAQEVDLQRTSRERGK
jgi:hypothetical protein